jgi:hypothetical protein
VLKTLDVEASMLTESGNMNILAMYALLSISSSFWSFKRLTGCVYRYIKA